MILTDALAQLREYPRKAIVRINWADGQFGVLLVKELQDALRAGEVFGRALEEIGSVEILEYRHLRNWRD